MTYPLKIGTITFDQGPFEGPNGWAEGLGDLGSVQKNVCYEFPGGDMRAQLLGSFPKVIEWSGILFGANARSRDSQLKKLCDAGEEVAFTYAEWNFDGFVEEYNSYPKAPTEIHFKIKFKSLADNSLSTGAPSSAGSAPFRDPLAGTVSNAVSTANQQTNTPNNGFTMPPAVKQGQTSLSKIINQQLQQTGGNVANLTAAAQQAIQSSISQLQNILSPMLNGSNPIAAAAAAELSATLSILKTAFSSGVSQQTLDTLTNVVNPDLYQLAAFYYGDPSLWTLIAAANSSLDPTNPYPLGTFTLTIPVNNLINLNTPPTVI